MDSTKYGPAWLKTGRLVTVQKTVVREGAFQPDAGLILRQNQKIIRFAADKSKKSWSKPRFLRNALKSASICSLVNFHPG